MPVTTVLGEDSTAIITDENPRRFSWSAAFAGALIATGVTFLLLTLGSGVGLSLVTVRHATTSGATTFLTLGAVYFLVAQAFGFAVGGHVVGRMIGPALETSREEEFRAGTHGLVSWALAVVATATIVALSVLVAGSAATNGAVNGALASSGASGGRGENATQPVTTSYWVDTLFRPATAAQAALSWRRYAQADNGTATDAMPPTSEPTPAAPSDASTANEPAPAAPADGAPVFLNNANTAAPTTAVTTTALPSVTRSLGADKAEAGRILTVGLANGGTLSGEDRTQLARLVSTDTGLTFGAAQARVTQVENRIREDEVKTAEAARKAAAYASLWTALALLFGAVVAVAAAISARWEDDREGGVLPGSRVVETRF
ncbi:MAG: hypothetical protein WDM91_01340 [Rhizomicrobium sp.]